MRVILQRILKREAEREAAPLLFFTGLSGEQTPKPNKHKSKPGPPLRSGRQAAADPDRAADREGRRHQIGRALDGRKISGAPAGANSSAGNDRIITRRLWKRYSGHFLRKIDPIRVKNPYNHPRKGKSRGAKPRTGENPPLIPLQAAEEKNRPQNCARLNVLT